MKYLRTISLICILGFGLILSLYTVTHASATLGTIDPRNVGNFKALLENTSMDVSAPGITFGKFTTEAAKDMTVSNTELRGFGWGEGIGWFVVNCADTTSGCSSANNNFKVANDGSGNLSGYAWGENTGWINFGPFTDPLVSTVKITNGLFGGTLGSAGYAWAQNFGWIKFDCSSSDSCVETDWGVTPGGGGGGGGSTPTCFDGIQNQNETGIDTGGVCGNGGGGGGECTPTPLYDPVPLSTAGPFTINVANATTIGFAIKTFDTENPAKSTGDFATENALNPVSTDQVVAYNPSANTYVLGFEDTTINGDSDFNDFVVEEKLSCSTASGDPCPAPSTLSDTTPDSIHDTSASQQNLQLILDNAGYILNKDTDQKQYQLWNVPAGSTITIDSKFIKKFSVYTDVFGYYTNGSMANFVPIFKTADVLGGPTVLPAGCTLTDVCPNILGNQSTVPPGLQIVAGQCVPISVGPTCYDGIQDQNETGIDIGGVCGVPGNPIDICPNITGNQPTLPLGLTIDIAGQCVPISIGATCYDGIQNQDETGIDTGGVCGNGENHTYCEDHPTDPQCIVFPPITESPVTPWIKLITALGLLLPIASAIVSYLVSNPLAWGDIPLLFGQGWNSFLFALGWEKRKKPWGIVYDSVTKRPIDPAYVVLRDLAGNEIAATITDINGRYGFAVDPGTYKISVNKSNYEFPSKKLAGKTSDNVYDDLYFGEEIVITRQGEIITKNIPIDQLAFDWNEYAKAQGNTHGQKLRYYRRGDALLYKLSRAIFWVGFAFSIYAMIVSPGVWNAVVLGLYIVMTIVRALTPTFHAKGSVKSRASGDPLPYSVVRLVSTATDKEVAHKVADRVGNYYGLVQNGTYNIVVDTKKDEQTYDKHSIPDPVVVKKGYLKKKFKV